jgi:RNA polymerase sigma-70 factor (sigma-E family)
VVVEGGTTTFDEFVREHQQALVRCAVLLSGSRALAEDIVQEVLVRIYPRWDALQVVGSPHAYVRRAITNEYLSWRRRWSTRHIHVVDSEWLEQEAVDPWQDEHDDRLWGSLQRLPRQQRAAVVLRYYEGMSDAEISEALGCREGTVRAHVSRGLAALRSTITSLERSRRDA